MHKVAIVGRPNVGKSSLFNRFLGTRSAVVADEPGVTRDVKEGVMIYDNHRFIIMDTGGLWSGDEWEARIRDKVESAISDADVVLFVVDARNALTSADYDVAQWLRRMKKPVVLLASKIDTTKQEDLLTELYGLGFGEPMPTSAEHARGLDEVFDKIISLLPEDDADWSDVQPIRVALIGRPNVGKSSLLNAITGSDRVIVSDEAGTTRDSIDMHFAFAGQEFILVDTAGIRQKPRDHIELFSQQRSERALKAADIAILVVDPNEFGDHELRLANLAYDAGKPVVIAINKWDTVQDDDLKKMEKEILMRLHHVADAPRVYTSAINDYGIHELLSEAVKLYELWQTRLPTADLNRFLDTWKARQQMPNFKGKSLKMYYITQAEIAPPMFIFFINRADFVTRAYEGFLRNRLKEDLGLVGIPIKIEWRERGPRAQKKQDELSGEVEKQKPTPRPSKR